MTDSVVETVIDLPLTKNSPPVLALGAYLKATACVIVEGRAHLSVTLGDLGDPEVIAAYDQTVARLLAETGAEPVIAAHDLHPDFHSTLIAEDWAPRTLAVQHHHAHIAAVAAEHGHLGPLLGLALDGFGLGPGNESWGGELLLVEGADYQRLGHLARLPQPGGDVAAREPWRMGAAVLQVLGRGAEIADRFQTQAHAAMLPQLLDKGLNCPPTSSCGRLFDAACGLLMVRPVADFEGQAPMELEALVTTPRVMDGGWRIDEGGQLVCLPLLDALIDMERAEGADLFHGTLAAALVDWVTRHDGPRTVGLSGGCFFNKVLTEAVRSGLENAGYQVLQHQRVSAGDPGLSLGQAWIAARSLD
ncbi:hypothetical protein [Magnetospira sp. QH-2]|uniref:Kae1-like domain-containing protein n=1 Tax=Magnetospira sp. (strain QH-2) TaxID=1288970 RepID=UPI0003E81056|nr:hypothetical protein [Magnetospira sp. QH-2]CCQ72954.1 putative hydrogenase maturation protein HypF remnant [Magnetospira sp. QH-2]